jgi:hypothetical protein
MEALVKEGGTKQASKKQIEDELEWEGCPAEVRRQGTR